MKEQSTRPGASRSMFLQRGDCGGSGGVRSHLRTSLGPKFPAKGLNSGNFAGFSLSSQKCRPICG